MLLFLRLCLFVKCNWEQVSAPKPGFKLVVNAEQGSMGEGIGCGVGVDNEPSPRRAAIEKTQEELRQEFVVREERRRELEFLEKGGNPLDFKIGFFSSSQTDPLAEQNLTSEGKGSFALNASPNRESAESNGRPETLLGRDLNTGDNFAGDIETAVTDRATPSFEDKGPVVQDGQISQLEGSQTETHIKESEDSGGVRIGVKGYARRNRHRSNRSSGNSSVKEPIKFGSEDKSQNLLTRIKGEEVKNIEVETQLDKGIDHKLGITSKSDVHEENGMLIAFVPKNYEGTHLSESHGQEASTDVSTHPTEENNLIANVGLDSEKSQCERSFKELDTNHTTTSKQVSEPKAFSNSDAQNSYQVHEKVDTQLPIANAATSEQSKEQSICRNKEESYLKDKVDDVNNGHTTVIANLCGTDGSENNLTRAQEVLCQHVESEKAVISQRATETSMETTRETSMDTVRETGTPAHDFAENGGDKPHAEMQVSGNSDLNVKSEEGSQIGTAVQNEPSNIPVCQDTTEESKVTSTKDSKSDYHLDGTANTENSAEGLAPKVASISVNIKNKVSDGHVEKQNQKPVSVASAKRLQNNVLVEKSKSINVKRLKYIESLEKKAKEPRKGISHWDYVLSEIAWMANDFMQERLWKMSAAAQVSRWVANKISGEQFNLKEIKYKQTRLLASSISKYWHDADNLPWCECIKHGDSRPVNDVNKVTHPEVWDSKVPSTSEETGDKFCKKSPLQHYAMRVLMYMRKIDVPIQTEATLTSDMASDVGIFSAAWEDHYPEESLFYTAPKGAMEAYLSSFESYLASEKHGDMRWDESTASWTFHDAQAGIEGSDEALGQFKYGFSDYADDTHSHSGVSPSEKNVYGDEDDTKLPYLPGAFDGSKAAKARKKRKSIMKASMPKSYVGRNPGCELYELNKADTNILTPSTVNGKRNLPPGNLNICSIPTKRIRSSTVAARQRAAGTYSGGTTGVSGPANKTDASSGDTSSLQDDFNTLSGSSQPLKNMDVDPVVNCAKRWHFDNDDTSLKSKKKKKSKHLGTTSSFPMDTVGNLGSAKSIDYETKWQQDVTSSLDQREQPKRKLDSQAYSTTNLSGSPLDHQIGNSQGVIGQSVSKKQKFSKQISDMSPEIGTPASVSAASPGASQLSNMSNSNKLIKVITGRDRGKKSKGSGKVVSNNLGVGIPWSTFEDQALVVLVHDFGYNWEFVSDMINFSLQIKSIFRKPKECKERHKCLLERTGGDGGESPEDSGSSQQHTALPGIPKIIQGSARMLLQRVQGPMEEETLKTHFQKIVQAGQTHRVKKFQNESQEQKCVPVHPSHLQATAHLQGPLTPLDLSDEPVANTEQGCQFPTSHGNTFGVLNPLGPISAVQPASAGIPPVQGAATVPLNSNFVASSATLNAATTSRDVQQRFAPPRAASVNMEEQQRMQKYNQMVSGRGLPAHGMISGMNRGMALSRPGFPGLGSPPILSMAPSGLNNILPCGPGGLHASNTINSGSVAGQGHLVPRSRDSLQMLRPGQSSEDQQRQIFMQELQLQAAQGNGQVPASFNNQTGSFSNQMVSSPAPSFPSPHQHPIPQAHTNLHPRHAYMLHSQIRQQFLQSPFSPNGSQLTQTQTGPLSQAPHAVPSLPNHCHQPPHPIPHVLQHQHSSLPQQSKTQSPPTLHQQTGASALANPSIHQQPGASVITNSMLQASQKRHMHHSQTLGQNAQSPGQSNQVQKQLQQRQQQQKHQSQHQQHKHQTHGQSQGKVTKNLEGGMVLQNLSVEVGQVNMSQSSLPANQHTDKGEHNAHSGQSQRVFTGTKSGQQGQNPGQLPGNLPQSMPLPHQQKGHLSQQIGNHQQHVPLATESHQIGHDASQPQLPASQQPSCSAPTSSAISSSHHQRQLLQSQPSHRKVPSRQTGPDAGVQPSSQINKGPQKDQGLTQIPLQPAHLTYQAGANIGSPSSSSSAVPLGSTVNSNATSMNTLQWKATVQNHPQASVACSLQNHGNVSCPMISSTTNSSGINPSLNSNTALQAPVTSSMLSHATTITGATQRQYLGSVGSTHAPNVAGGHPGVVAVASQQMGAQWQSQQQPQSLSQQQQRPGHSGIQKSHSLGSPYVDPPTSSPM